MSRRLFPVIVAGFFLAGAPALQAQNQDQGVNIGAVPDDRVVARVNGVDIRFAEVMASMKEMPEEYRDTPPEALFPLLVRRAVNKRLLAAEIRKSGIGKDPQLQAELEKIRQDRTLRFFLARTIGDRITPEMVQAAYDNYLANSKPEPRVHARHIRVSSEIEAEALIKELDNGADFAALAVKRSNAPSGRNGGDLGFFGKGDMAPVFEAAAFGMAVGEYSRKPLYTPFGWHIIKVVARKERPSFEDKREEMRRVVGSQILRRYVDELRARANVEHFPVKSSLTALSPPPAPPVRRAQQP